MENRALLLRFNDRWGLQWPYCIRYTTESGRNLRIRSMEVVIYYPRLCWYLGRHMFLDIATQSSGPNPGQKTLAIFSRGN